MEGYEGKCICYDFNVYSCIGTLFGLLELAGVAATIASVGLAIKDGWIYILVALMLSGAYLLRYWSKKHLNKGMNVVYDHIYEEFVEQIITSGPYQYIRHPWYLSDVFIFAGVGLVANGIWHVSFKILGIAYGAVFLLMIWRALYEESFLSSNFDEYAGYRKKVRRLIPGLV